VVKNGLFCGNMLFLKYLFVKRSLGSGKNGAFIMIFTDEKRK